LVGECAAVLQQLRNREHSRCLTTGLERDELLAKRSVGRAVRSGGIGIDALLMEQERRNGKPAAAAVRTQRKPNGYPQFAVLCWCRGERGTESVLGCLVVE